MLNFTTNLKPIRTANISSWSNKPIKKANIQQPTTNCQTHADIESLIRLIKIEYDPTRFIKTTPSM